MKLPHSKIYWADFLSYSAILSEKEICQVLKIIAVRAMSYENPQDNPEDNPQENLKQKQIQIYKQIQKLNPIQYDFYMCLQKAQDESAGSYIRSVNNGRLGGRPKKSGDNPPEESPIPLPSATASNQAELFGGDCSSFADKKSSNRKSSCSSAKKKLTRSDVVDWNTLFKYWEQNKNGKKYADDDSRADMLNRLRKLTNNNFEYAKVAIYEAVNNGWQGFCGNDGLYYKGAIPSAKPKRPADVDELPQMDGTRVWYDYRENKVLDIPFVPNHEPDWSRWDDVARKMK